MKIIITSMLQVLLLASLITVSSASSNWNSNTIIVNDGNAETYHHGDGNQSQVNLLHCAHYEVAAGECLVYEKISDVRYDDDDDDDDDELHDDDTLYHNDAIDAENHVQSTVDSYYSIQAVKNSTETSASTTTSTHTSSSTSPPDLLPFDDLWDYYHCSHVEQRLTDENLWTIMRQTYRSVVGPEESSIPPPSRGYNGMTVPYKVAFSPGKGRGIFANANIAEGTMIWAGIMMATFTDGYKYMEYLERLASEYGASRPDFVCNAILWTEVLPVPYPHGDLKIVVNLDEGALCNDGVEEDGVNSVVDHELEKLFPAKGVDRMFASRDIQVGEELLCDYASYGQEDHGWEHFGMAKEESDEDDVYYDDEDDYDDDMDWR